MPTGFTLRQLHQVLIAAMGWHGSHLHHFFIRGNFYGKPDPELGPETIDELLDAVRARVLRQGIDVGLEAGLDLRGEAL